MNSQQGTASGSVKNDTKHRDYLVQQEKLRSMAHSTGAVKALDADSMIENLLSRSETFRKNKGSPQQGLPPWLSCNSSSLPKVYKNVWLSVKSKSTTGQQQYCDTQFLTSVLLTSGISTECLGHIWALCNKTAPGLLTEQELYQVLALIALAQLGRPWNNIVLLQKVEEPVVPCLNYNLLAMSPGAPDPGIHSTYLPSRMAMSIPSPIQMFQNTTNSVLSNNKASLELNPSLLESMLSNNFSQPGETAPVTTPPMNNLPSKVNRKQSDSDFSDAWTEFMDHTANVSPMNLGPSIVPTNPSVSVSNSSEPSRISSAKNLNTFELSNQNFIGAASSFSSGSHPSQANTVMPSQSAQNDFVQDFSSLTVAPSSAPVKDTTNCDNDDEFTDFQSFDTTTVTSNSILQTNDDSSMNIESLMKVNAVFSPQPKTVSKKESKKNFLSNESDEVVYGQKGYVVENPLYVSDTDSIYDNNSVSSLKFDTISLDLDPSQGQGTNLFQTGSVLVDSSKPSLDVKAEIQSSQPTPFIQMPSLISANAVEDKYSVFRMLEVDEKPPKEQNVEEDEFGDFLTADFTEVKDEKPKPQANILDSPAPAFLSDPTVNANQKEIIDHPQTQSLQEICMDACISVLRNAVEKFSSLNPDVLKLVLCEDKCIDYIQALTEIYRIAEKMIQSVKNSLYADNLNNVWKDLNSYVSTKFSVEECDEENDYSCTLCNSSSGSAVIKYGTSYYHVPCINFYLNCVDSNLPD